MLKRHSGAIFQTAACVHRSKQGHWPPSFAGHFSGQCWPQLVSPSCPCSHVRRAVSKEKICEEIQKRKKKKFRREKFRLGPHSLLGLSQLRYGLNDVDFFRRSLLSEAEIFAFIYRSHFFQPFLVTLYQFSQWKESVNLGMFGLKALSWECQCPSPCCLSQSLSHLDLWALSFLHSL